MRAFMATYDHIKEEIDFHDRSPFKDYKRNTERFSTKDCNYHKEIGSEAELGVSTFETFNFVVGLLSNWKYSIDLLLHRPYLICMIFLAIYSMNCFYKYCNCKDF